MATKDNDNTTTNPYQALNEAMVFYVPELQSRYGQYPLRGEGPWPSAQGVNPDGKPNFLASPPPARGTTKALINDFVWGTGTLGFGYYHLTTKESYRILAARLREFSAPDFSGLFSKAHRKRKEQLKQIEIIMYYRGQSPVPNDTHARKHGEETNAASFAAPDDWGFWQYRLK